jgi:hypothetical protein
MLKLFDVDSSNVGSNFWIGGGALIEETHDKTPCAIAGEVT